MFRLYDFVCTQCKVKDEHLVDTPHGEKVALLIRDWCYQCNDTVDHERVMSMPAPYMGEKVVNPIMHGGKNDTAGKKALPPLPELKGEAEYQAKLGAEIAKASSGGREAVNEVLERMSGEAPSSADYGTLFDSKEYKKAEKRRARAKAENDEKKKRLKAIRRGEQVNMKRDKCRGDPKIA